MDVGKTLERLEKKIDTLTEKFSEHEKFVIEQLAESKSETKLLKRDIEEVKKDIAEIKSETEKKENRGFSWVQMIVGGLIMAIISALVTLLISQLSQPKNEQQKEKSGGPTTNLFSGRCWMAGMSKNKDISGDSYYFEFTNRKPED